ncbi:hypothetical protein EES43_14300 [Streptomyces sp. ADI96-02]|nr:hypothetical protein EES43_14300 [Streptomyces sp. ADI96-02]
MAERARDLPAPVGDGGQVGVGERQRDHLAVLHHLLQVREPLLGDVLVPARDGGVPGLDLVRAGHRRDARQQVRVDDPGHGELTAQRDHLRQPSAGRDLLGQTVVGEHRRLLFVRGRLRGDVRGRDQRPQKSQAGPAVAPAGLPRKERALDAQDRLVRRGGRTAGDGHPQLIDARVVQAELGDGNGEGEVLADPLAELRDLHRVRAADRGRVDAGEVTGALGGVVDLAPTREPGADQQVDLGLVDRLPALVGERAGDGQGVALGGNARRERVQGHVDRTGARGRLDGLGGLSRPGPRNSQQGGQQRRSQYRGGCAPQPSAGRRRTHPLEVCRLGHASTRPSSSSDSVDRCRSCVHAW